MKNEFSFNIRRINRDQISKIARLSSSKNFVCKIKSLIISTKALTQREVT